MVSDGAAVSASPATKVNCRRVPFEFASLSMTIFIGQGSHAHDSPEPTDQDLYVRFKTLQRQLEFVEIQVAN